jgi:hypothetical protein
MCPIHDEFHHLFEIHNDLKLTIRDSDPVISAMGKEMILKYEKYWGIVMKYQNSQEDLDVSEKIVRGNDILFKLTFEYVF